MSIIRRMLVAGVTILALTQCSSNHQTDRLLFSIRPVVNVTGLTCSRAAGTDAKESTVPARPPIDGAGCFVVGEAIVDASDIASAVPAGAGAPPGTVNVRLDSAGSKAFDSYTATHAGERLAIMVQSVVVAAPKIVSSSYRGHVTFTTDPAAASRFVAKVGRS